MITMTSDGVSIIASVKAGKTTFTGRGNTANVALEAMVEMVEKHAARGDEDAKAVQMQVACTPGMPAAWAEVVEALRCDNGGQLPWEAP